MNDFKAARRLLYKASLEPDQKSVEWNLVIWLDSLRY